MENLNKKINLYFMLLILELFILISIIFFSFKALTLKNYILLSIDFLIVAISFYTKPYMGLVSSFAAIILYGGFLLYSFFIDSTHFNFSSQLVWILSFPIIGITSAKLKKNIVQLDKSYTHLSYKVQNITKTDSTTGLYNKQKFYEDILQQSKKITSNHHTAILLTQLINYNKLASLYGNQVDKLIKSVAFIIPTDNKYRISKDTLAVLLPNSDIKTAEKIRQKLYDRLKKLTLNVNEKAVKVKFDIKIELLKYDTENTMSTLGGQAL